MWLGQCRIVKCFVLGRGNGEMRLPLLPPDDRGREALRRTLDRYGLKA